MRKITLKTTRYETADLNDINSKIVACVGECVFADTKELAGTRRGFSGDWNVTNLNGETKHFTTEKGIREWLGKQEVKKAAAKKVEKIEEPKEMNEIEMLKYYKENKISFTIAK